MAKPRAKQDPMARRQGETHLQWQMRLALSGVVNDDNKDRNKPSIYVQQHGEYQERFVNNVEERERSKTCVRRSPSALAYMRQTGKLTDDEFWSAQSIAEIAEMLERNAGIGCASLEARVDCSGSARDALNESLYRVRAEGAYTEWRSKLPIPRRMVIDMVTRDAGFKAIAREHNMGWPKAQQVLKDALGAWPDILAKYVKLIDQDDLDLQHAKLRA